MELYTDVTETIGNTPLVRLDRFYPPRDGIEILAKLEFFNPGGSIKDRIGVSMILDAEERGQLQPGGTIIEVTAGNTGIGLALVAALRGYRAMFVVPEAFSQEKQMLMRAMGAEVVNTPTADGMKAAIARGRQLSEEIPGAMLMQQFANPANIEAHYRGTGPEIWEQAGQRVNAVVLGAGTGGTFTGVVRYLKEQNPALYAVIVQPYGATLGQPPHEPHKVEGIGIGDLEPNEVLDLALIDRVVTVRDENAHAALKELARTEGLLVGGSAGAAAHAARLIADEIATGDLPVDGGRIVTLFADSGERYLSQGIYGEFKDWER
jgi:O-acetylserine dependent cystathionine beta-synthase